MRPATLLAVAGLLAAAPLVAQTLPVQPGDPLGTPQGAGPSGQIPPGTPLGGPGRRRLGGDGSIVLGDKIAALRALQARDLAQAAARKQAAAQDDAAPR